MGSNFSRNWHKLIAPEDISTAKSLIGCVIMYMGCLLVWASKLKTQIALRTAEAEYMVLSQPLWYCTPVMLLLQGMKDNGIENIANSPEVYCKSYEDNSGALELECTPKLRPQTKHMNVVYNHFRSYVRDKSISILPINSFNQSTGIITKSLPQNGFLHHRKNFF